MRRSHSLAGHLLWAAASHFSHVSNRLFVNLYRFSPFVFFFVSGVLSDLFLPIADEVLRTLIRTPCQIEPQGKAKLASYQRD